MEWGSDLPTSDGQEKEFDLPRFIENARWTFAKTMPHIPHWYTVRKNNVPEEFEEFVKLIRKDGFPEKWGSYENVYLEVDGWKYWTMGAPIEETTIINREPMYAHHSALPQGGIEQSKAVARFAHGEGDEVSEAFVHDITGAVLLPPVFDDVDVLHIEMPWTAKGQEIFSQRAGLLEGPGMTEVNAAVRRIVETWTKPLVVLGSETSLAVLPAPEEKRPLLLQGRGIHSHFYNCRSPWPTGQPTNLGLLRGLADVYDRVGDPVCGYGLAGRVFMQAGGTYVMSDINPYCIGYIAEHTPEWAEEHWGMSDLIKIGPHRVRHGDIMDGLGHLMDGRKASIFYSDPPWGQGALSMWQTLNTKQTGVERIRIDHAKFLARVFDLAAQYTIGLVFIEYGVRWEKEVLEYGKTRKLRHLATAHPTYRSGSGMLPLHLHCFSNDGTKKLPGGLLADINASHGQGTSMKAVVVCNRPNELVLDPCCGGGYTARAACAAGMAFRGQEINRKRLGWTIDALKHLTPEADQKPDQKS